MTATLLPGADDFARIEAAFSDAVPLDAVARGELLANVFQDRPDLYGEVQALLAAHDRLHPVD